MDAPESNKNRRLEEAMADLRDGVERVRKALDQGWELRGRLSRLEHRADFLLRGRPPSAPLG